MIMKKHILCATVLATLGTAASTGAQATVVNSGAHPGRGLAVRLRFGGSSWGGSA